MIKTPRNAPCSEWEDNWADRLDRKPESEGFYWKMKPIRSCRRCKEWVLQKICPFCGGKTADAILGDDHE